MSVAQERTISGDHSRNSWYTGCGMDILTICSSHQRPQLSSLSRSQTLHVPQVTVGDLLSGLVILPHLHHVEKPSITRVHQGWLLRSSGSVNACTLVCDVCIFCLVHLLLSVAEHEQREASRLAL